MLVSFRNRYLYSPACKGHIKENGKCRPLHASFLIKARGEKITLSIKGRFTNQPMPSLWFKVHDLLCSIRSAPPHIYG
jgi:hypothetical protein